MDANFRVNEIFTDEDTYDVIAKCYDILYDEEFEKFLGNPDEFSGKENASNLLKDSNYEISDEVRADIEDIFGVVEFDKENEYGAGYQFYDFDDDDIDDFDDEFDAYYDGYTEEDDNPNSAYNRLKANASESFNLREALNRIDLNTYNKYDLLNLYESCNLSENEKRALANIVYDQDDPRVIYDTLNDRFVGGKEIEMPERVKDGVIHEDTDKPNTDPQDLRKEAMRAYKENDGEFFKSLSDEELVILWKTCLITDGNKFGAPYDDEVYDAISDRPNAREIFDRAKGINEDYNKRPTFRGVPNTEFISHGEWADPEVKLTHNGKTYIINYWTIEDSIYDAYKSDRDYANSNTDSEAERLKSTYKFDDSDEDFNKYCQENADYITYDIIEMGEEISEESLKEDWTHFTYKSGANPYIATNDKEAKRIIRKYKDKCKKIKDGYYEIDDTNFE